MLHAVADVLRLLPRSNAPFYILTYRLWLGLFLNGTDLGPHLFYYTRYTIEWCFVTTDICASPGQLSAATGILVFNNGTLLYPVYFQFPFWANV